MRAFFDDARTEVGHETADRVGRRRVVRVDERGTVHDFAVNRGKTNGPASRLESGGLERPVSVRFDPAGEALYVVDFGVILHDEDGAHPQENTGVLWRITRGEQR